MEIINYLSAIIIPLVIVLVIGYGIAERKNVYDIFLRGAKNGIKIVVKLFPTLLAIFLSINMLRNSGVIDFIINILKPVLLFLNIPIEIMPLALLRPISGTASMAVAIDIIKNSGVDSKIGLIVATIMGSTETVFYTIALYTSSINIKKTRFTLMASLIANFVGIVSSIVIFKNL